MSGFPTFKEQSRTVKTSPKFIRVTALLALLPLSGCNMVVMSPSGDIAAQQRDLIIISTVLMLLIIIPVICLTLFFAWRYRQSNTSAPYAPEWNHSSRLEIIIWAAPLAIVIALGSITWIATHKLDPYRPLDRIDADRSVPVGTKPLTVEVVALDWKWLFFYPELGIATVNEMAAPVDVPIDFKITSSSVMNSFYIPALAGQVYAMPGMETKLHAVINDPGEFDGFSANYSGPGFSHMRFRFHGLDDRAFESWVAKVKAQGTALDRTVYLTLKNPSLKEPVHYYASADRGLYQAILNMCTEQGKMCANEMMHIDMMGGAGRDSEGNRDRLKFDGVPIDIDLEGALPAAGPASSDNIRANTLSHEMPGMRMSHDHLSMPGMEMGDASVPHGK